ncbi:peroxiredoxin family protein [Mucilaginibacter sp. X4EP1]|jgi:peroxiredoxin|uniref:peroxiredoxin family protein n=1 Tax=Mucilaginibacter sp. X4EP1 TaxID=2723092 RepID=UPI0021681B26|nr:TlpA disulfide reductase family protein [Mucilaginibacter sp. X4EP1]MCS3812684.1 peroxiredoxin [Mucilaginibacter sp. X4EP1]
MKTYLFIAVLSICSMVIKAQTKPGSTQTPTYMMPDGTFISKDKIDSVSKAWNGALTLEYEEKDKAQGILHLVKLSDAVMKQIADQNAKADSVVKAMVNKPAPDFNLTDIHGKKWSLLELRGKVVVLNFWYTSCPPCLEEMPDLNEITKLYKPDQVVFLALTFNDASKVQTFLKTHEFAYNILPNSKTVDQQYKVSGWPTSLVINKEGIIKFAINISSDIKHDLPAAIDANL